MLLEAMAADVPIVASNISPIVDSVPVESMPFLVNPSDCQSCVETVLDFH